MIYTSIGTVLIAINPFKRIENLYDEENMRKYKNKEFTQTDEPHVFAIADAAYTTLEEGGMNQSLIISGESGAGKTESTKQCLNYLANAAGSGSGIQTKILKAGNIHYTYSAHYTLLCTLTHYNSWPVLKLTDEQFEWTPHHVEDTMEAEVDVVEKVEEEVAVDGTPNTAVSKNKSSIVAGASEKIKGDLR